MGLLGQITSIFTHPALAAAGVAATAIPVVIHLYSKYRRQSVSWAAMRFLQLAYRRHRRRIQLEHLLLLLLRCALLIIVGLALSDPVLAGMGRLLSMPFAPDQVRDVHLVIDDSLSTHAQTASGTTRFDELRQRSLAVLDELGPGDRVSIWLAGRPAKALYTASVGPDAAEPAAGSDLSTARETLRGHRPRYSRADLPEALALVDDALSRRPRGEGDASVVLISDFARDVLGNEQASTTTWAHLGPPVQIWATHPMPDAPNTQLVNTRLNKAVVLVTDDPATAVLHASVQLKRYAVPAGPSGETRVVLTISRPGEAEPVATTERQHTWVGRQDTAEIQFNLPINRDWIAGAADPTNTEQKTLLAIHTAIDAVAADGSINHDSLRADDQAWTLMELRDRLRIALIDEPLSRPTEVHKESVTPAQWLQVALSPWTAGQEPSLKTGIQIERVAPGAVMAGSLKAVDAAMVLRPDRVGEAGWSALRAFAHTGGLVWVLAPVETESAGWPSAFQRGLGLGWRVSAAPVSFTPDTPTVQSGGWSLALDDPAPERLAVLGADWPALLRPVRLHRRLEISANAGVAEAWITTADRRPVLISQTLGAGQLLLLATAIDTDWTNLPTCPLFVPLLHESLRSWLGARSRAHMPTDNGVVAPLVCGDRPSLSDHWSGADRLLLLSNSNDKPSISLARDMGALRPATPLELPGLYAAAETTNGSVLAVNVDPAGADTRGVDTGKLERFLDSVGDWRWLDTTDTQLTLSGEQPRRYIGWPLLWVALGLIVVETVVARWVSHAGVVSA